MFFLFWMERKVSGRLQGRKGALMRSVGNGCPLFKPYAIGGTVIYFVYCSVLRNRMGLHPARNHWMVRKAENSKKQQAEGELP